MITKKIEKMLESWKTNNPSRIVRWRAGRPGTIIDTLENGKVIVPHKDYPRPSVGEKCEVLIIEMDKFALAIPYSMAVTREKVRLEEAAEEGF